ncbi:hypothetical protein CesoFtcFv8_027389 [Champsocephalus esox]|nr:hypothetical protein CesoFtcFv8_027389 [Champsocephalus esox]
MNTLPAPRDLHVRAGCKARGARRPRRHPAPSSVPPRESGAKQAAQDYKLPLKSRPKKAVDGAREHRGGVLLHKANIGGGAL